MTMTPDSLVMSEAVLGTVTVVFCRYTQVLSGWSLWSPQGYLHVYWPVNSQAQSATHLSFPSHQNSF